MGYLDIGVVISMGGSARLALILKGSVLLGGGYCLGVVSERNSARRILPSGLPHSCSQGDLVFNEPDLSKSEYQGLRSELEVIVGKENVMCSGRKLAAYTTGSRIGKGDALAVVQPGTLKETVRALRACVKAGVIVIPQGRNTGLTGGSVPRSDKCNRPTVVISTVRLNKVHAIGNNHLLCCGGVGIYDLSLIAKSMKRESHSVLGSMFLNPTVSAGIAFGSGGTQIRKGPSYTEQAIWCRVNAQGEVEVINTIDGASGSTEDELLDNIEKGYVSPALNSTSPAPTSDAKRYAQHVCELDNSVSRCNADTSGIDPCRSEGKVFILASVHDTFPEAHRKSTYWISCRDFTTAQALRQQVLLHNPADLPISCEYMDRDSIDVVDTAGRVLCGVISYLGIGDKLSSLWSAKLMVESIPLPVCKTLPDKLLYYMNGFMPPALPPRIQAASKTYDHHILVTLGEFGDGSLQRAEERLQAFVENHSENIVLHRCTADETNQATYFRFAAAPAFRTYCVGKDIQGISIDYALRKNDMMIPNITDALVKSSGVDCAPVCRMRYSHFGCNVVHEDIAFLPSADAHACQMGIKKIIEGRGGRLPAEHGHGTEYVAPPGVQARWKSMDPCNVLNAGVGGVGYGRNYEEN